MQRYDSVIQNDDGSVAVGVVITVRSPSTGVLSSLYSDAGVTAKANPVTTDANGHLWFYAADGDHRLFFEDGSTRDITLGVGSDDTLFIRKTTTAPIVTGSTTLQNDSALIVPIGVGEIWHIHYVLKPIATLSWGLKYDFTVPAGMVFHQQAAYGYAPNADTMRFDALDVVQSLNNSYGALDCIEIHVLAVSGLNAGNITLRYAQKSAGGGSTYMDAGSWLIARKVA